MEEEEKDCTHCKSTFKISSFHLKGKDKKGNPRYQSTCKPCANIKRVERYKSRKVRNIRRKKTTFCFSSCDIILVPPSSKPKESMRHIMTDYIEDIYAIKYTKIEEDTQERPLLRESEHI